VPLMSKRSSSQSSIVSVAMRDAPAPERHGFRAMQSRACHLRNLRIAEMFDAGKSVAEIAKAEHLTPTWVCSILDATGVRRKRKRGPGIPLGEMPEIVRLSASGWSLREIGGKYGISGEGIRQAITSWPKRRRRVAIAKRRAGAKVARTAEKIPFFRERPSTRRMDPCPRNGESATGALAHREQAERQSARTWSTVSRNAGTSACARPRPWSPRSSSVSAAPCVEASVLRSAASVFSRFGTTGATGGEIRARGKPSRSGPDV